MILALLLHLFAAQHAVVPNPNIDSGIFYALTEPRGYTIAIGDPASPNSFYVGTPLRLATVLTQPQTYTGCSVTIGNGVVTIVCPATPPPLTIVTPVALPPA